VTPRHTNNHPVANAVTSCSSCLAWGMTYCQGMCQSCYEFTTRHKVAGDCGACGRHGHLKKGYCRLCWVQAALNRSTAEARFLAPYLREMRHHQLFLAGVGGRPMGLPTSRRPNPTKRGRFQLPPGSVPGKPRVLWVQLALFAAPRQYRYPQVDPSCRSPPENEWLYWGLHLARTMAEARDFDRFKLRELNRTLVMLLAEHRDGELIRTSDFSHLLRGRWASFKDTTEVLESMGVLIQDPPSPTFHNSSRTFDNWLASKLEGLAPGLRVETERWARTLHDGGPRARPHTRRTVTTYVRSVRPALLQWSASYHHLREVTREDILAHAERVSGQERRTMMVAFRSLFGWARKNGVVFRNPATGIKVAAPQHAVWQPLAPDEIARTIAAATTPEARVVVVLAAVHAARVAAIRALQLDDVDLPNRRLTIAAHTRPLDDLTHQTLLQWLDYRRLNWPNTANNHLLINATTALGLGPVSGSWANRTARGLPANLERLRIDRQLEEALTHDADPLHLAAVFGIQPQTAIRYAASARQLLEQPLHRHPSGAPQTQLSRRHDDRSHPPA
jgi:hypothetical protein